MKHALPVIASLIFLAGIDVPAQSPAAPKFEVASIKPNRAVQAMQVGPTLQAGGRVLAVHLPLDQLIRAAFALDENQLLMPTALADATFDVDARAGKEVDVEQARAMLRTLLAERFGLKAHRETRELPIFTLVRVSDTRLGPQLAPAGPECAPLKPPGGFDAPPPPPPPPPGAAGTPIQSRRIFAKCPTMFFRGGGASARSITIDAFAEMLGGFVGRPIVNKTGLIGDFDLDLLYVPETGAPPPAFAANAPSLPTALQEQLGLKLESGRAPVEVLVVDSVQQPTAN